MKMRYSKSANGFFPESIKYKVTPGDLIDVSADEYEAAHSMKDGETLDVVDGRLVVIPARELSSIDFLSSKKIVSTALVISYCAELRKNIAGTSDPIEVAAWSNKLRIATAIQSGTAIEGEVASFEAEIEARKIEGETLEIFCQKVAFNAAKYSMAVALLDGIKRAAQDAINAATTKEEVDAAIEQMKSEITTKIGV